MDGIKNELDYKILELLCDKKTTINGIEYTFIKGKNNKIITKIGDKKYLIDKNYKIYSYNNNRRGVSEREINEFEKAFMILLNTNYTSINCVEYELYELYEIKKLIITRYLKDRIIVKKVNIENKKLLEIRTKNKDLFYNSFNNAPSKTLFKYEKNYIVLTKYYHNDGKIENFNGSAHEEIKFDYNWNEILKINYYFINDKYMKKEEFDIMKYFCKNGIDIEKFYKFKNTVNYKKILEGIQIYNKYNNKEDKELEKLKLLIKLEGE